MEETISLKELFQTLKKRAGLIIALALIAVTVSGIVSYYFITPTYQSSTQILVNKATEQNTVSVSEVQTNLQLINTYNVIIKSPAILDLVSKELNLDLTSEQLSNQITVQSEAESQVINLSVVDTDPLVAAEIANKTAQVFKREIKDIMSVDNVNILSEAIVGENQAPIKPQPVLNMAIALVVGLMAGVGIAFLLEFLDNTIKSESDVEQILQLPVLGAIPTIIETETTKKKASGRKSRVKGESLGA